DDDGLRFRQLSTLHDEALHGAGFVGADGEVGPRDTAEDVGEASQVARSRRVHAIERLDDVAHARRFALRLVAGCRAVQSEKTEERHHYDLAAKESVMRMDPDLR